METLTAFVDKAVNRIWEYIEEKGTKYIDSLLKRKSPAEEAIDLEENLKRVNKKIKMYIESLKEDRTTIDKNPFTKKEEKLTLTFVITTLDMQTIKFPQWNLTHLYSEYYL